MAFRTLASGVGVGRNAWLFPLDVTFKPIGLRYGWLKALFDNAPAGPLAMTGRLRAERAAWRAVRRVPAYRAYLSAQGVAVDRLVPAGILEKLPETDKRSYIDPYPLPERCLDGRIAFVGTTIDESSGSTGTPYNWIRSEAERHIAHRNISFFARYCFGSDPLVTINAFSMGAWATGFNMTLALNHNGIVKSTGPDIGKILSTMRFLGPGYRYLILGYPPFVKYLLDEGDADGMPWNAYHMQAMVGGEGMTEELRDHLLQRFESVYSGYGATDIEIGMARESPRRVAVRRLAPARPRLPFLWIYGRRDATISVMGANIYPEDVETIIYRDGQLAGRLHSFCLSVVTDSSATPRPCIALELNGDSPDGGAWSQPLVAQFQAGLAGLNLDYRAALGE